MLGLSYEIKIFNQGCIYGWAIRFPFQIILNNSTGARLRRVPVELFSNWSVCNAVSKKNITIMVQHLHCKKPYCLLHNFCSYYWHNLFRERQFRPQLDYCYSYKSRYSTINNFVFFGHFYFKYKAILVTNRVANATICLWI